MKKNSKWTMKCPKCEGKIPLIIEPLPETMICPECGTKYKVVKKLLLFAQPINPALPNKSNYSYDLQAIDE